MPTTRFLRTVLATLLLFTVQCRAGETDKLLQWTTWTLLQAVPSPGLNLDHGPGGRSVVGELRWQVVPLNYSFAANRFVSAAQCFIVNPIRRHSGSVEGFAEPAWALGPYRHSGDERLALGLGLRMFLPLAEYGENLSISAGVKYVLREAGDGEPLRTGALEFGVYTLFGVVGMKVDLTADPAHRASFSLALKYY